MQYSHFNSRNSLLFISSFPGRDDEVAKENAVARYSHLLVSHFPQNQKLVIICEKRSKNDLPYLFSKNVLVVPSYKLGSILAFFSIAKQIIRFNKIKSILVQFEFTIFGNRLIGTLFAPFVLLLGLFGKRVTVMLHQVVNDINEMSQHLGLKKKSLGTFLINVFLDVFYKLVYLGSATVLVHSSQLQAKLTKHVPQKKVAIIPHGVSKRVPIISSLRTKSRKQLGFTEKDMVVLVYGYQSWYKGSDFMVEKMGALADKYPKKHFKLLLAGDLNPLHQHQEFKKFAQELEKLVKKYASIVVTTGFVPEEKEAAMFAAADITVLPNRFYMSSSGSFSLSWQYQKPFLASLPYGNNLEDPDIKKALSENHISKDEVLFSHQGDDFEEKLMKLVDNPGLQKKLSQAGKQIAAARDWSKVANRYLMLSGLN